MAPPLLPMRHYVHTSHVTEDTPPDLLEGTMDLLVTLPSGKDVLMNVHRSTPMMDLLVQVTTTHRLSPGSHVIKVVSDNVFLSYKPSTPVGTLETSAIKIVPKNKVLEKNCTANSLPQAVERNIRLKVVLPRNQLAVYRVSPKTPISVILKMVCQDKNLDEENYEIRHPVNVDERLRGSCSLDDYQLQEVCVVSRDFRPPPLSVTDLITMASVAHPEDKKRRGFLGGLFSRKPKSSTGDSSVSSGSAGERSISPARSDESVETKPGPSHAAITKASSSPPSSGCSYSRSDGTIELPSTSGVSKNHHASMVSLSRSRKRLAPDPPKPKDDPRPNDPAQLTKESKTPIASSLFEPTNSLERDARSFHTSPSNSEVCGINESSSSDLAISAKTNLTKISSQSVPSLSVSRRKRKAPTPPLSSLPQQSNIPEASENSNPSPVSSKKLQTSESLQAVSTSPDSCDGPTNFYSSGSSISSETKTVVESQKVESPVVCEDRPADEDEIPSLETVDDSLEAGTTSPGIESSNEKRCSRSSLETNGDSSLEISKMTNTNVVSNAEDMKSFALDSRVGVSEKSVGVVNDTEPTFTSMPERSNYGIYTEPRQTPLRSANRSKNSLLDSMASQPAITKSRQAAPEVVASSPTTNSPSNRYSVKNARPHSMITYSSTLNADIIEEISPDRFIDEAEDEGLPLTYFGPDIITTRIPSSGWSSPGSGRCEIPFFYKNTAYISTEEKKRKFVSDGMFHTLSNDSGFGSFGRKQPPPKNCQITDERDDLAINMDLFDPGNGSWSSRSSASLSYKAFRQPPVKMKREETDAAAKPPIAARKRSSKPSSTPPHRSKILLEQKSPSIIHEFKNKILGKSSKTRQSVSENSSGEHSSSPMHYNSPYNSPYSRLTVHETSVSPNVEAISALDSSRHLGHSSKINQNGGSRKRGNGSLCGSQISSFFEADNEVESVERIDDPNHPIRVERHRTKKSPERLNECEGSTAQSEAITAQENAIFHHQKARNGPSVEDEVFDIDGIIDAAQKSSGMDGSRRITRKTTSETSHGHSVNSPLVQEPKIGCYTSKIQISSENSTEIPRKIASKPCYVTKIPVCDKSSPDWKGRKYDRSKGVVMEKPQLNMRTSPIEELKHVILKPKADKVSGYNLILSYENSSTASSPGSSLVDSSSSSPGSSLVGRSSGGRLDSSSLENSLVDRSPGGRLDSSNLENSLVDKSLGGRLDSTSHGSSLVDRSPGGRLDSSSSYESASAVPQTSVKSSRSNTETSYESAPPPLPQSVAPDFEWRESGSSCKSSFSDYDKRQSPKVRTPSRPLFSISTYQSRAEKMSYDKKLVRSESLLSFREEDLSHQLKDDSKPSLNRTESVRNEIYRSQNTFNRKATPRRLTDVYRQPPEEGTVVKVSRSETASPTFHKAWRPQLEGVVNDVPDTFLMRCSVFEPRFTTASRFQDLSKFESDLEKCSDSTVKQLSLSKTHSDDNTGGEMPAGGGAFVNPQSKYRGNVHPIAAADPLTGEYLRLQDDFVKWQQQLLQNQHVLHSKVAPIATNPSALHSYGMMKDLDMPITGGPRKPVEINIPIKMEDTGEVVGAKSNAVPSYTHANYQQMPNSIAQSQPIASDSSRTLKGGSWRDKSPPVERGPSHDFWEPKPFYSNGPKQRDGYATQSIFQEPNIGYGTRKNEAENHNEPDHLMHFMPREGSPPTKIQIGYPYPGAVNSQAEGQSNDQFGFSSTPFQTAKPFGQNGMNNHVDEKSIYTDSLPNKFTSVVKLSNEDQVNPDIPPRNKALPTLPLNSDSGTTHNSSIKQDNEFTDMNQRSRYSSPQQGVLTSSPTPMSARLVKQAVQQPQKGSNVEPENENAGMRSRSSPPHEESPPPFAGVALRHVETRVSPPRWSPPKVEPQPFMPSVMTPTITPQLPTGAINIPPPPPPPARIPPAPRQPEERLTSTGKKIISSNKEPELDAREELMMAIRQFGGSVKLRKSYQPPTM